MDLENATRALDNLSEGLELLEREYAIGSIARRLFFARYPLARYAVPFTFLRAFVASEGARRTYREHPTAENAQALAEGWERAAVALREDIRRCIAFHRIVGEFEGGQEFVMQDVFGYRSTFAHILETLELIEKNACALVDEVRARASMLRTGQSAALPPERARPLPALVPAALDDWHREMQEMAIAGGTWPYRYGKIREQYGPFSCTLPNFDGTPKSRIFNLYVLQGANGLMSIWPALVDRLYFIDKSSNTKPSDSIERGAYATFVGLNPEEVPQYWHEPPTNLYNSRDCSYWMDIASAIDIVRRPDLDRALVERQRSSMFDMLLAECARDTRSMIAHLRRRVRARVSRKYSLFYDLLTRSFPSVYYLSFNQSVWRLDQEPQFLGDGFRAPDPSLRLSDEAIKLLAPDVLRAVMGAARLREERGRAAGWLT